MKDTVHGQVLAFGRLSLPLPELAWPIFGAVSDAVLICMADTLQIMTANPAALGLYGYSLDELRSMSLFELSAEPDAMSHDLAEAVRAGKTAHAVRTHMRKDGTLLTVEASGTIFAWRRQQLLLAVIRDYSERQAADNAIRRHLEQAERTLMGTVESISAMTELRDPYTAGHERRVGALAERMALELGLSGRVAKGLRVAGLVHDIGKIGVPAETLSRPGRLSALERSIVEQHARKGYEVLRNVEFPWPVAEAVLQHHERLDGSGYPDGLRGDTIIADARILAVADVVEAMASHRPYRPSLGIDRALAEIEQNRGRLYDSAVVDACLRLFRDTHYLLPSAAEC